MLWRRLDADGSGEAPLWVGATWRGDGLGGSVWKSLETLCGVSFWRGVTHRIQLKLTTGGSQAASYALVFERKDGGSGFLLLDMVSSLVGSQWNEEETTSDPFASGAVDEVASMQRWEKPHGP